MPDITGCAVAPALCFNINDALLQFINVLMILTLFNFTRWSTVLDRRCITRLPRINSAEYLTL